jgi:hypothetical protein
MFGSITTTARDIARQVRGGGPPQELCSRSVRSPVLCRHQFLLCCMSFAQAFSWFERENITAKAALARWLVALGRATMVGACTCSAECAMRLPNDGMKIC